MFWLYICSFFFFSRETKAFCNFSKVVRKLFKESFVRTFQILILEVYHTMGLFGFKKKEENSDLPPLQFPELPKSVPSFEPQGSFGGDAEKIKNAVFMPLPSLGSSSIDSLGGEKPLFVKVEKYRDVVETLKKLKARLNDADSVLSKLGQLREEEDRELAAWQSDLERIRGQLLDIDRKLFE